MLSDIDKGWLAGIIDGEGWIGLIPAHSGFQGKVVITNTNELICHRVRQLLDELLVPHSTYFRKADSRRKMCQRITVCTPLGIERLLLIICPFLVGKVNQGLLLHKWTIRKIQRTPERSIEWDMHQKIKELNS